MNTKNINCIISSLEKSKNLLGESNILLEENEKLLDEAKHFLEKAEKVSKDEGLLKVENDRYNQIQSLFDEAIGGISRFKRYRKNNLTGSNKEMYRQMFRQNELNLNEEMEKEIKDSIKWINKIIRIINKLNNI